MVSSESLATFLPVLVVSIISFIIGSLWYSPILFGNIWMKGMGLSKDKMKSVNKGEMFKSYFIMFLGSILTSYLLSRFIGYIGVTGFVDGAKLAMLLWLGFMVPVMVSSVLWEGKPWKVYFINVFYQLVAVSVSGGILAYWQ